MIQSKLTKYFMIVLVSLSISHLPEVAFAAVAEQMISTTEVVESLTRVQAEAKVRSYLDREDIQRELNRLGVSPGELRQRVSSLSVAELNQLSTHLDQARYGGDIVGLAILVLVIVLIIYLVKRI